jgi:MYXO-CTERM domain-containing protein
MNRQTQITTLTLTLVLAIIGGCTDAPNLVEEEGIGVREAAIVNGSVVSGYQAVGALHSGGNYACTATLIGKRTVLTAAHCVTEKESPYNLLSPVNFYVGGFYGGVKYTASSVVVHPNYAGGNKADIAVVRLNMDVAGVTPKHVASTTPAKGENVLIMGYGKTGENSGSFGTKRQATNTIGKVESQIFRIYGAGGTIGNICNGDSGGPTFATRNGQEELIGVTSTKGGTCGVEGNAMRADVFYAWIAQQAQGDLYQNGPADKTPPKVQIVRPFDNSNIAPSVNVQVVATDDSGVTKVLLFVDGKQVGKLAKIPYAFNLQGLQLGNRTLEAVAYDKAGRTGSASVKVLVVQGGGDAPSSNQPLPFGSSCTAGNQCQSKLCVNNGSAGLYCSRACSGPSACPGGFDCVQGVCLASSGGAGNAPQGPLPGTFGASCSLHSDCNSGLCAMDNVSGRKFCTATCDLNDNTCPGGAICHPAGAQAVCGLPSSGEEDFAGGCSIGSGATSAAPLWTLLGLALLLVLRHRR